MTTILDKEPASQEGRENLTQVADSKRMEGTVRIYFKTGVGQC